MGYHLRRCSRCNKRRLFKRKQHSHLHPDDMTFEQLQEYFHQKVAEGGGSVPGAQGTPESEVTAPDSEGPSEEVDSASPRFVTVAEASEEAGEDYGCPKCGSPLFRRSRRRYFERLFKRPRMARCLRCDYRFPYPE